MTCHLKPLWPRPGRPFSPKRVLSSVPCERSRSPGIRCVLWTRGWALSSIAPLFLLLITTVGGGQSHHPYFMEEEIGAQGDYGNYAKLCSQLELEPGLRADRHWLFLVCTQWMSGKVDPK